MDKSLEPATFTQGESTADKPFVRVYREKDTGNVIIALDAEAMAGLSIVLDVADLKEMHDNPGYLGLDVDDAHLASGVGYDILGQLKKLAPYGRY